MEINLMRNLLKIIFFASTFFLITNTSSVYSETIKEKCKRIGKEYSWDNCGDKLRKDGDLWGATAAYGKSIMEGQNTRLSYPYFYLGFIKNKLGDQEGAIEDYTKALSIDPYDGISYNNRGTIYQRMRKIKLACDDYLQGKYNGNKTSFKNYSELCEKTNNKFQIIDVIY